MREERRVVDDFECAAARLLGGFDAIVFLQELDEANARVEVVWSDCGPALEHRDGGAMMSVRSEPLGGSARPQSRVVDRNSRDVCVVGRGLLKSTGLLEQRGECRALRRALRVEQLEARP